MRTAMVSTLSRTAALAIIGLLLWIVTATICLPLWRTVTREHHWRDEMIARGTALLDLEARRPQIEHNVDRLRQYQVRDGALWTSSSDVALAAAMEERVRTTLSDSGQVLSVSSAPVTVDTGLQHIRLRVVANIRLSALGSVLTSIEQLRPRLFIDRLAISAAPSSDVALPPMIGMECDVSAFAVRASLP